MLPAWYSVVQDDPESVEGKWYRFLTERTFIEVCQVISAVLSGVGSGFMWVSQGEYMARCATEASKGFYFGYFWAWYMAAQIVGNLTGALIVEKAAGVPFFAIMGAFGVCCSFLFCFLRDPKPFPEDRDGSDTSGLTLSPVEPENTFSENLMTTARLLVSKEMLPLVMLIIWNGTGISYWSSLLTPIMAM